MKIVGNLLSGGVLLEVSLEEYGALIGTAITLAGLPTLTVPVSLATMPANKASAGLMIVKKAERGIKGKKERPLCQTCGKPVTGFGRYKYCSKACSKAADDESKRRSYERRKAKLGIKTRKPNKKHATAASSMPVMDPQDNLSNPALTNEERKTLLARRLELIKKSAQAHADD